MPPRLEIDCSQSGWEPLLESAVRGGGEANLIHFDFIVHGEFCVRLANQYKVEFRLSREPGTKEATFRKPWK